MEHGSRAILHVDMDAFFASVEQRDDPSLRGKPVLVGGSGPRGVVTAASYEARVFGCRSAQPMAQARRLCPHAIVVGGHHERYREASKAVFAILESYTPLVEPLSIDEAFMDVTGSQRLFGSPRAIAESIRARILDEVNLTASVGCAPNKYVAKLASDWEKPDGLVVVEAHELPGRLAELPIRAMWGVGPAAESRLLARGIATFGDLQNLDRHAAVARLGPGGERLWRLAHGLDQRRVTPDSRAKSIGHEQTFGADLAEPDAVRAVLLGQVEQVAERLRRYGYRAQTVTVKIRYGAFETITRSRTRARATDRTTDLWETASELFDAWAAGSFRPVRLIGASLTGIEKPAGRQLDLFAPEGDERLGRLDAATDAIRARFGRATIRRGMPLGPARPASAPWIDLDEPGDDR